MASIVVRNIPDDVFEGLKKLAKCRDSSLEAEVRHLIAKSVFTAEQARTLQNELEDRNLTPSIELLREDRDR